MKRFALVVGMMVSFVTIFAQSTRLEDYISSAEYAKKLRDTGEVRIIHEESFGNLSLVPNTVYKDKINSSKVAREQKKVFFLAEFARLIPKSELKSKGSRNLSEITIDEVAKVFRSISKMKGMEYDFDKKGKGKVLYKDTYMISSLSSNAPIPDQNTGNANGQVSYSYQNDDVYGDMKFQLNYFQEGNVLYSTFLLKTPMNRLGVKAVDENNMKISIMAIDLGEELLLYLINDVSANSIPLVPVRNEVQKSMISRMEAIQLWFLKQF